MNAVEFGKYLKSLRKRRGLTMVELSNETGLSQPYISQIERGKKGIPSTETLAKFAKALNIDKIYLWFKAGHIDKEDLLLTEEEYEAEINGLAAIKQIEIGESKENEYIQSNDLTNFIMQPEINYKGRILTSDEKQRILDMLEILLKE